MQFFRRSVNSSDSFNFTPPPLVLPSAINQRADSGRNLKHPWWRHARKSRNSLPELITNRKGTQSNWDRGTTAGARGFERNTLQVREGCARQQTNPGIRRSQCYDTLFPWFPLLYIRNKTYRMKNSEPGLTQTDLWVGGGRRSDQKVRTKKGPHL